MRPARVRSLEEAAAFVERVGLALVYPSTDLVLPSLWEAVAGPGPVVWAERDERGKFLAFSPEFDAVWRWKDELPERRLACSGKHLGRVASLVAPGLLAPLYALTGRGGRPDDFRRSELSALQAEVAEAVLEHGACTGLDLRRLLEAEKRRLDSAVDALQRELVLTHVGVAAQEAGWPAVKLDLLTRHWQGWLEPRPALDAARRTLAERVLAAAGELSTADLAAALRWRRAEAASTLDELAERGAATAGEEDGIRIWSPVRSR